MTVLRRTGIGLALAIGLGPGALGCAPGAAIHARMSDEAVREAVARELPAGLTLDQAQTRLDGLRVSRRHRMHYPATETRPEVLLVRLFDGGFWLESDYDDVEWLDLSLVFEAGGFDRAVLYRDHVRYFGGDPVGPPTRAPAGPMRRYPGAIPPPADPLEGAR